MPPKEVRWKLTVEEYTIRNSPDSWTSPLPGPETEPALLPTPTAAPLVAAPNPKPVHHISLPTNLQIHPSLTPTKALQLDLSFPSDAFRRNPQLTHDLLAAPACSPARSALSVRIAAGLYKAQVQIRHHATETGNTDGDAVVTVGDVLTAIQRELRQYDGGATPAEAQPYMHRRIVTMNGYPEGRSAEAQAAAVVAEGDGGGRMVDQLLGHTMFTGLTVQLGQPDHCWQLELGIPERYAH